MSKESSSNSHIREVIQNVFPNQRVLVVGDLMLDRYIWGDIGRISPEAPVPIVRREREEERPGGAGNVALNLAGLGLRVVVGGFIGADKAGESLLDILETAGIATDCTVTVGSRPTTTKMRVLAGHQHVLRMDNEETGSVDDADGRELLARVQTELGRGVDGIILSDYAKGALSDAACQAVIGAAKRTNVPVFVDPKGRNYDRYAGATVLTPNLSELALASGVSVDDVDGLIRAAHDFVRRLGLEHLALTRGAEGMTLIAADRVLHEEAVAREVFDVSGAGDTVIATLVAGHLAKLDAPDMLRLANVAAGIVVTKVGTAPIDRASLLADLRSGDHVLKDACSPEEIEKLIVEWRRRGLKIVLGHGCFDLLHVGHASYLRRAAMHGDRLIVALETDRLVRASKGPRRPVTSQADRARVLTALACVDAVVYSDENPPLDALRSFRPDILVTTAEHGSANAAGEQMKEWGGSVTIVPLFEDHSTSGLIEEIAHGEPAGELAETPTPSRN